MKVKGTSIPDQIMAQLTMQINVVLAQLTVLYVAFKSSFIKVRMSASGELHPTIQKV